MRGSASLLWVFFLIGPLFGCGEKTATETPDQVRTGSVPDLLNNGRVEEARRAVENASEADRKKGWYLQARGRLALLDAENGPKAEAEKHLRDAIADLHEALTLSSSDYLSWVFLGKAQGLAGELVDGVKSLETAIRVAPQKGDAYFELGRLYRNSGEIDAAMETVNQGLEMDPNRADGLMLYGSIVFDYRNLYDEGLVSMREALKIDPELPGGKEKLAASLLYLGMKSLQAKENDDVLMIVDEVLGLFPDNAEALRLRAQVYAQTDRTGKAIDDLRKCIDLDAEDLQARRLLGRALIKKGYQLLFLKRREEALKLFREAVDLKAPDVDTTVVARILEEDEHKEAAPDPAKNIDPDREARSLFEQASVMLEAGQAEQALALLERSIALLPNNPYAHHQAGLALDLLNRPTEAEKELKLALSLGRSLKIRIPATYLKLAELAIRAERFPEGEKYLDEFDERFPDQKENPLAVALRRQLIIRVK